MKVAIYPGSFNPWHEGHQDVLDKALKVFDQVIIAQGVNPEKNLSERARIPLDVQIKAGKNRVKLAAYKTLLKDFVKGREIHAVIKGLRNGQDFEYEKTQQYWNEDLGLEIPTVYFISDRKFVHISSSAIKQVEKARLK